MACARFLTKKSPRGWNHSLEHLRKNNKASQVQVMDPRVRDLYKRLIYIAREYPWVWHDPFSKTASLISPTHRQGIDYIRPKLKAGFQRNRALTDTEAVDQALEKGEYIYKGKDKRSCPLLWHTNDIILEIETLIFLRRYREMKRRYYSWYGRQYRGKLT